jgi:hypothetical protein
MFRHADGERTSRWIHAIGSVAPSNGSLSSLRRQKRSIGDEQIDDEKMMCFVCGQFFGSYEIRGLC